MLCVSEQRVDFRYHQLLWFTDGFKEPCEFNRATSSASVKRGLSLPTVQLPLQQLYNLSFQIHTHTQTHTYTVNGLKIKGPKPTDLAQLLHFADREGEVKETNKQTNWSWEGVGGVLRVTQSITSKARLERRLLPACAFPACDICSLTPGRQIETSEHKIRKAKTDLITNGT